MGWLRTAEGLPAVVVVCALPLLILAFSAAVAAMTAIWHPDAERRRAAYRVLDRLLRVVSRAGPQRRGSRDRADE